MCHKKVYLSILFYEIGHQTEDGLIAVEDGVLPVVIDGMVIGEGCALLVFEEDAGHMALSKGIVVAVGGQVTAVQCLEILLLAIDLLKEPIASHALVAHLTILHGVVVANHVDIEQVSDLL